MTIKAAEEKIIKSDLHTKLIQDDNVHISFSEFSLYNECGQKHLIFKYLALDMQEPSIHLFFGNAIHEAIEMGVKNGLSKEERAKYFADKFRKDMMDNMLQDKQFNEVDNFIDQGNHILLVLDTEVILKGYQIVSVEDPLYEVIYKKFRFKGFIDLIAYNPTTGRYLIVDWKTSGEEWDVEKKKKDGIFLCQMRFYKYFWGRKNKIPLDKIDCKYVVLNRLKNKKNPNSGFGEVQVVDINSTEEEIFESLNRLGDTLRNIHVEKAFPKVKFTGNERMNCMFCKFKGGIHPLCNSKYNQYVELLQENEQKNFLIFKINT
jgi:hypothetical protein